MLQPQQGRGAVPSDREGATENPYPALMERSPICAGDPRRKVPPRLAELDQAGDGAGLHTTRPWRPSGKRAEKLPVWWEADTRDEIHRALDLAAEFGTTAVIVGGREAAKVVDRLKAEHVAVVLRLNVPEGRKFPPRKSIADGQLPSRTIRSRLLAHRKECGRNRWRQPPRCRRPVCRSRSPTEGLDRLDRFPRRIRALISAGSDGDQALAA